MHVLIVLLFPYSRNPGSRKPQAPPVMNKQEPQPFGWGFVLPVRHNPAQPLHERGAGSSLCKPALFRILSRFEGTFPGVVCLYYQAHKRLSEAGF